jgi:hypothetical protein
VLSDLPAPTGSGTSNNYQVLQQVRNDTYKAGGKVDVNINDRMTAFGRFGWRDLDTFDEPPVPLPSGGGRAPRTSGTSSSRRGRGHAPP